MVEHGGRGAEAVGGSTSLASTDSPLPLYHRLYLILRDRILRGDDLPGALLPGEHDLARRFQVSRVTARRALDELAIEGLVKRRRGDGTRVRRREPHLPLRPIAASIDGLIDSLGTIGRSTTVELVEFGYVAAGPAIGDRLRLAPDARVQRAVRIRSLDGTPVSQSTTFLPESIGYRIEKADLARMPLIALLKRAGISIGAAEQSITAALADATTAQRLGIAVGSALLLVRRIIAGLDGSPVQAIDVAYRPDRIEYRMTLSRRPGAGEAQELSRHD
jgi:GntR family transcriptional regulator